MKKIISVIAMMITIAQADACNDYAAQSASEIERGLKSTTVGERKKHFWQSIDWATKAMFTCENESDKDKLEVGMNQIGSYIDILNQFSPSMSIPAEL